MDRADSFPNILEKQGEQDVERVERADVQVKSR